MSTPPSKPQTIRPDMIDLRDNSEVTRVQSPYTEQEQMVDMSIGVNPDEVKQKVAEAKERLHSLQTFFDTEEKRTEEAINDFVNEAPLSLVQTSSVSPAAAAQAAVTEPDFGYIEWSLSERTLLMVDAGLMMPPSERIDVNKVARFTGLSVREISNLRCHPLYRVALTSFREKYHTILMSVALAAKTERLQHIQARHDLASSVVAQRKAMYEATDGVVCAPDGTRRQFPELKSGLYKIKWIIGVERSIAVSDGKSSGTVNSRYQGILELDVDLVRMLERAEADVAAEVGDRRTHLQIETNVKLYGGFDPDEV